MALNKGMQSPNNGSVPNPDPTERTVEQLLREIATAREIVEAKASGQQEVVETRFNGMDKAIELLQKSAEKIPQYIKDSVNQLESLHNEKFSSIEALVDTRFDSIDTQFAERDKRTEQLSLADKTAIAAALQAQKEAAGATNESNSVALVKMETNFTKLLDQLFVLQKTGVANIDEKINDVKSRLDRGEGKSSVSDPQTALALERLTVAVSALNDTSKVSAGSSAGSQWLWGMIVGGLGLLCVLGTFIVLIVKFAK